MNPIIDGYWVAAGPKLHLANNVNRSALCVQGKLFRASCSKTSPSMIFGTCAPPDLQHAVAGRGTTVSKGLLGFKYGLVGLAGKRGYRRAERTVVPSTSNRNDGAVPSRVWRSQAAESTCERPRASKSVVRVLDAASSRQSLHGVCPGALWGSIVALRVLDFQATKPSSQELTVLATNKYTCIRVDEYNHTESMYIFMVSSTLPPSRQRIPIKG